MTDRFHHHTNLIYSSGTQVVAKAAVLGLDERILHPKGAVGTVVYAPENTSGDYRVRFLDGVEVNLPHDDVVSLAKFKEGEVGDSDRAVDSSDLYDRVIFRCVIGSRAYGLETSDSDTDRRGVYLPPADRQWSLYGVPEQLEKDETQEVYWELKKFLKLALKANPNVLECLYTPLVETTTPLGEELLGMRSIFLSKLVYQTYNGYAMSQFKRMQAHIRNHGEVKWKHVMHMIRLLLSGTQVLREGFVPIRVEEYRERLIAIKQGETPWEEVDRWRESLHTDFERAFEETTLPERPDYERANSFLIKARRYAAGE
jgi:uncharacterized protein